MSRLLDAAQGTVALALARDALLGAFCGQVDEFP